MTEKYLLHECKACQHEFRVPAALKGRDVLCPYCGTRIHIAADNSQSKNDKLIGQSIRGCTLERRLGAGAMGAVYQCHYVKGNRTVAMKLLSTKAAESEEVVKRFLREAELCKKMNHPNIIKVYDFGEERGAHYMVMEMVDGTDLAGVIEERGRLDWKQAMAIIRKVASALAHAGEQDIIHRDIKPANILMRGEDDEPKLADLGLGKQLSSDNSPQNALTMQGAMMGTPAYMPPEQIADASSVNQTADIYSLGATFYYAVTGQRPFEGKNAAEIMSKLRNEEAPLPSSIHDDIPNGVDSLIMRMLEKLPEYRPENADELIELMDKVMEKPDQEIPRKNLFDDGSSGSAGKIIAIVLLIAVLAGGIAAWYFLFGPGAAA